MKNIKIPEYDKIERKPKSKMPDCPSCERDELGFINKNIIICYYCNFKLKLNDSTRKDKP